MRVVRWDEKKALCDAYRDQPPSHSSLDETERSEAEEREDEACSRRLAAAFHELRMVIPAAPPKNSRQPELSSMTYEPETVYRLEIAKDYHNWNRSVDPGWVENTSDAGRIDVYCDLLHETTDYHFSSSFQYRHGRPVGVPITRADTKATVRNTKEKLSSVPKLYRAFAHSTRASCVCTCDDCSSNPNCECALFAKVVNKGNVRLKNNRIYLDLSLMLINHESLDHVAIGCGLACACYRHRKCDRNVDLLHLLMPKLEIFRRDPVLNFGVRTLNSLRPGEIVCEFTGRLETIDQVEEHSLLTNYAYQVGFEEQLNSVIQQILEEMEKNADYRQFGALYNDLVKFANECKKPKHQNIKAHISPFCIGNVAMFVSHGCLPNLHVVRVMSNHALPQFHRLFYVAARPIAAGEELFISYGAHYFARMEDCLCGTPLCLFGKTRAFALNMTTIEKATKYVQTKYVPHCRELSRLRDEQIRQWRTEEPATGSADSEEDIPHVQKESDEVRRDNTKVKTFLDGRTRNAKKEFKKAMEEYEGPSSESDEEDYFSRVKVKREPADVLEVFASNAVEVEPPEQQRTPRRSIPEIKTENSSDDEDEMPAPRTVRTRREHTKTARPPPRPSRSEVTDDELEEKPPAAQPRRSTRANNAPAGRGSRPVKRRSAHDEEKERRAAAERRKNAAEESRKMLEEAGVSLGNAAALANFKIPKRQRPPAWQEAATQGGSGLFETQMTPQRPAILQRPYSPSSPVCSTRNEEPPRTPAQAAMPTRHYSPQSPIFFDQPPSPNPLNDYRQPIRNLWPRDEMKTGWSESAGQRDVIGRYEVRRREDEQLEERRRRRERSPSVVVLDEDDVITLD